MTSYFEMGSAIIRGTLAGATGTIDVTVTPNLQAGSLNFAKGSVTFDHFIAANTSTSVGQTIATLPLTVPDDDQIVLLYYYNVNPQDGAAFYWDGGLVPCSRVPTLNGMTGFAACNRRAFVVMPSGGAHTLTLVATAAIAFNGLLGAHFMRRTGSDNT